MSVNTTQGSENQPPENVNTPHTPVGREHVENGELSNGGLDLPVGEAKSDTAEAEREGHHEWHPDTGNQ